MMHVYVLLPVIVVFVVVKVLILSILVRLCFSLLRTVRRELRNTLAQGPWGHMFACSNFNKVGSGYD